MTSLEQPAPMVEKMLPFVEYSKFTVPVAPAVVVDVIVTDVVYVAGVVGDAVTETVLVDFPTT